MPFFWVVLWSMLPAVVLSAGADSCTLHEISSSSHNESPFGLESLQCLNDYESHVHCTWREHRNTTLQLWFKTDSQNKQCVRNATAAKTSSELRTVHCTYKTRVFSIGIKHTVFFLKEKTPAVCSSDPHKPLELSQHLRARPPVNLSTQDAGDGGWWLSWSSPYSSSSFSSSSSSLTNNIKYQLSYRTHRQDNWTSEHVTNTSVKLEKRWLVPGQRYEARVRAQASVGHWSDWTPVVTWQTEEDVGKSPSLHCVLDGEKEVMCSWKVSRELAHFITYQLVCGHNQSTPSERCCVNPSVTSSDLGVLKYSCSLAVANPARLLLELLPTRNARIFKANKHIRPKPPQQVKVREEGHNWKVEWTHPSTVPKLSLYYEVCYDRKEDQGPGICLNMAEGSTSLSILGASLAPFQVYQVKVRSLVVPGDSSIYQGVPSEWTDAKEWTSHDTTWSPATLIYFSISVFVATVVLTVYCTISACQRKVILWVDSVPSPAKSKTLSEIKSSTIRTFAQIESTSICRVLHSDSESTCSSSVASLWSTKDSEKRLLEQDEGCWSFDKLPFPDERVNSSISYSGPYIFCQSPKPNSKPREFKCAEKEKELGTMSDDSASPCPSDFTLYGEGYLRLPCSISRSSQDLVSHSDANTNTHRHGSTEQDQPRLDSTPPAYTSVSFNPWPQEGAVEASGYCHIPTASMRAAN